MHPYFSTGKIMLTGEYLVLDGARSFTLASRLGQHMWVYEDAVWNGVPMLIWQALDKRNEIWFEASFVLPELRIIQTSDTGMAIVLADILHTARELNPQFLRWPLKYRVENVLQFERHWGLGSSSTLIANIAQWAGIDPFELYRISSNGSGYDLAVALQKQHIQYRLEGAKPQYTAVEWNPSFADDLIFVALGNKQVSSNEVSRFQKREKKAAHIDQINAITESISELSDLSSFEEQMKQHEAIVSEAIGIEPIQKRYFSDYKGVIKSLGAWGGDLILVTRVAEGINYFQEKGFTEIIPFRELVEVNHSL